MTPVVARDMAVTDLVELMLDATGKDIVRLGDLLRRGSMVSGGSRYRWTGLEASAEALKEAVAKFPDPEPERPFKPERCYQVRLEGPALKKIVPAEALQRKRFFRRRSFWEVLVEAAAENGVRYSGYSYGERADRYELRIPASRQNEIESAASLLRYSTLETQIQGGFDLAEFFVRR